MLISSFSQAGGSLDGSDGLQAQGPARTRRAQVERARTEGCATRGPHLVASLGRGWRRCLEGFGGACLC